MLWLMQLACAEWFASETDSGGGSTPFGRDESSGDDNDDDTTGDESSGAGQTISFVTFEADVSDGEDVEMDRPQGARLFRIESCFDDYCADFDGHYYDYNDGTFVIAPSARDFDRVTVTWMKVE